MLIHIAPAYEAPYPRTDRPLTDTEFAQAVAALVAAPLPDDWVGPTEEDLEEMPPAPMPELAARFRGHDTLQRRFGLR